MLQSIQDEGYVAVSRRDDGALPDWEVCLAASAPNDIVVVAWKKSGRSDYHYRHKIDSRVTDRDLAADVCAAMVRLFLAEEG